MPLNQFLNRSIFFLIPLIYMMIVPWNLNETGLWVGYGKHLWQSFSFLYQDSISILPTNNNTTSAWLISLLYYGLYEVGDVFLVAAFHHVALFLILYLIYKDSLFKADWPWSPKQRLLIYLFWFGTAGLYSLRPVLLSFIPLILSFKILDSFAQKNQDIDRNSWLKLIVLQVLWVNFHGSFILLPAMIGWTLLARKRLLSTQSLGLLAIFFAGIINPYGWKIYPYLLQTQNESSLLGIAEWASPFSLDYPTQTIAFWLLLVGFAGFVVKNWRSQAAIWTSPLVPLLILPFMGLRLSVYAWCAVPLFVAHWSPLFRVNPKFVANKNTLGPALGFALMLGIYVFSTPPLKSYLTAYLPAHLAASYDEESIFALTEKIVQGGDSRCPTLNDFNVGGFLMMKTENPLLIDGRVTPFTKEAIHEYLAFMRGENILSLIERNDPCYAVLSEKKYEKVISLLEKEHGFTSEGRENGYRLLKRVSTQQPR